MRNININTFFENFPILPEAQIELLEKYLSNYPASQWLTFLYAKMLQEKNPKRFEKAKNRLLPSIQNRQIFQQSKIDYSIFSNEATVEKEVDEVEKLMEQFEKKPPKIKFDPAKHNAEINLAENFDVVEVEFISETLAMIYAEQGYTGNAIQMIKKLIVQYPEKNAYFAALIEKVKTSSISTQNQEVINQQ